MIQRMENIDKHHEIPPRYNDHVFPEIPDEFWKKVSAEKKKKSKGERQKKKVLCFVVLQYLFCADFCHCAVI